ncbi:MAG TPA: hypothetical protein VGP38_01695, partial [Rubrobacter sp.]|nr:hypothetical protein [Rubrobacter sp.]
MQGEAQHDDRTVNGRVREDSVYLAALRTTAPVASIAAVGFTVIIYLVTVNVLDRYPKIADYKGFSGDAAVVAGLLFAVVLWLALAASYRRYTSAQCANRRNYNLLCEKLDRLNTRANLAIHEGYEPQEWLEDETGSGTLRAMRYQALEQVKHECEEIRRGLEGRGMPWVTGLGYIELWHRMHRAEEALIKVEPYPDALE